MGEVVSAAVPVNFWPSFNASLSEKTLNIFSVSKFATSGSFIFPNEISHSEQISHTAAMWSVFHFLYHESLLSCRLSSLYLRLQKVPVVVVESCAPLLAASLLKMILTVALLIIVWFSIISANFCALVLIGGIFHDANNMASLIVDIFCCFFLAWILSVSIGNLFGFAVDSVSLHLQIDVASSRRFFS